ncbi:glycosyltransferase family 2 protein [Candidatus Omnitrophota bacterium]
MKYSVIIAAYNEQQAIAPLYWRLKVVMDQLGKPYEIIFVNDGSTDSTFNVLEDLRHNENHLIVINCRQNQGQAMAFQIGFRKAQGSIVITMDGDLQNEPKDIPQLLNKLGQGYDVVCGWRRNRADPFLIKLLSKIANISRRILLNEKIHDVSCSLRVYKKEVLQDIKLSGQMYYMLTAILSANGYKLGEIEVENHPRKFGKSKFDIKTKLSSGWLLFNYLYSKSRFIRNNEPS